MPGFLKGFGRKKESSPVKTAVPPAAPAVRNTESPVPPQKATKFGDEAFVAPGKEVVRPDNQLQLSEKDLQEEIAKMLTANNPAAPKNLVRFNMKERTFKSEPMVEQLMVHYSTDGFLLHRGSEEARRQLEAEKAADDAANRFQAEVDKGRKDKREEGTDADGPDDSRQLRNQFNFSERAAQTFNYPMVDRGTTTEPPPTASMTGTCNQWEVYDAYIEDQERQRQQEELNRQKAAAKKGPAAVDSSAGPHSEDQAKEGPSAALATPALSRAARVLERMENQNLHREMAMDFKYWDDIADQFRQREGTLLPLWRFQTERCKRKHVTSLCWNPEYDDLFAVGYGSFDFLHQSTGMVCCYSLKNTSYPEYEFATETGVMCLDFHPQHANLLAVGCYDGSVSVFDVRSASNKPMYRSTVVTGKHTDPVWQICWQEADMQKQLQFFSVASDGRVTLWTLEKSELTHQEMMMLKLDGFANGDDVSGPGSLAGGCCFDFKKAQDHLFVVGTEEGRIHKCSKAYNSEYLQTYAGHKMAVYAVKWNLLHSRVFLSASADWSVRLWDGNRTQPVMTFDLDSPVGDVAWAPYSATVFAAVTDDGKVHVYDLSEDKQRPLCKQKIVKKAKLTKMAFNPKHPILIVGDDRGCVCCLKLSPNLRKALKPSAEDKQKADILEVAKLDKVIAVALKGDMSAEA